MAYTMEILNAKKGRKALQYRPAALDPDDISDDEYYVMSGNSDHFYNNPGLSLVYSQLIKDSNNLDTNKTKPGTTERPLNAIQNTILFGTSADFTAEKNDFEDDFKRETILESVVQENIRKIVEKIKEKGLKIGRQTGNYEMFIGNASDKGKKKKTKVNKGKGKEDEKNDREKNVKREENEERNQRNQPDKKKAYLKSRMDDYSESESLENYTVDYNPASKEDNLDSFRAADDRNSRSSSRFASNRNYNDKYSRSFTDRHKKSDKYNAYKDQKQKKKRPGKWAREQKRKSQPY
ncbi:hypothetical protein SteCoe_26581 [Stentor coeruleus]|uniref:Uncharacterized protein n=1 Tax=Stentor coeruleus TaxID=5963 RepID=A0A1R2BCU0_9CILI|nr:hypothetical protein SteCoe_26581 [Stentor coeruleus]